MLKKRLGKLYVSVYSGDRSGKPSVSKYNTWQANRELEWFLPEIKKVFGERGVWLVRKRHIKYYVVYYFASSFNGLGRYPLKVLIGVRIPVGQQTGVSHG